MSVTDGAGGAIFTWEDRRSGEFDIYAQRITASGKIAPGWSEKGVEICINYHDQRDPVLIADGQGGAIIVWFDWRTFCEPGRRTCSAIYAQRVGAAGAIQWQENGVPICSVLGDAVVPHAVSDGAGGAIVAWSDYRSASPPYSTTSGAGDIYAQRIDGSGVARWSNDGVAISTAAGTQWFAFLDSDGAGGAMVTWCDGVGASDDIYVNRITAAGVAAAATPVVAVPADIRIAAAEGVCSAKVEFNVTARGLPEPTLVCTPPSGKDFPVGQSTVQCKATNSSGTQTRTFLVTVIEPGLPTVVPPPPITVPAEPGVAGRRQEALELGKPTATDGCPDVVVSNDAPEMFPIGTTLVIWTATDASGNKATATQAVTVTSGGL